MRQGTTKKGSESMSLKMADALNALTGRKDGFQPITLNGDTMKTVRNTAIP